MTSSTTTTHVLALLIGATISYFIFRCPDVPTELPPIQDETAITVQVERRVRAQEVRPLLNRMKADSIERAERNKQIPVKIIYRYHEQAKEHWSLNDSLSGALYLSRVRASIPDTVRSENR